MPAPSKPAASTLRIRAIRSAMGAVPGTRMWMRTRSFMVGLLLGSWAADGTRRALRRGRPTLGHRGGDLARPPSHERARIRDEAGDDELARAGIHGAADLGDALVGRADD